MLIEVELCVAAAVVVVLLVAPVIFTVPDTAAIFASKLAKVDEAMVSEAVAVALLVGPAIAIPSR